MIENKNESKIINIIRKYLCYCLIIDIKCDVGILKWRCNKNLNYILTYTVLYIILCNI